MSFVFTQFKEKVILDKTFDDFLATELSINHISQGAILIAANEISLDPISPFTRPNFQGPYKIILVADDYNSKGGIMDISGGIGNRGKTGNLQPQAEPGKQGENGNEGKVGKI